MTRTHLVISTFAALMAPSLASAAAEWSRPVSVTSLQVYSDPDANNGANEVVVKFSSDPFESGCPWAETKTWYVEGDPLQVGRIIALLTAARLAKANVRIFRSDPTDCRGSSTGAPGYPKMRGVELSE